MKTDFVLVAVALFVGCAGAPRIEAQTANQTREAGATSVPRLVQFSGTLKDASARAVSGAQSVTFAIYAEQDGGVAIWSETQNVIADTSGRYNVLLGGATPDGMPAEVFNAGAAVGAGASRWLGVTVAREAEMPRVLLASVPYALKAQDADTLGGLPASAYVTTSQLASRGVIAAPATTIVASPSIGTGNASNALAGTADAGSQSVTQATITGTGTANYLPLWTSGTNLGVSKIYQASGGFVGVNTNTPLLQLDVNGNSIFRGSFQMAPQGTATAGAGQPSHSFQWQASLFNSSTNQPVNEAFGFRTVPDQNNTSNPTAKLDLFYGPGGGTLNDTGLSINHSGIITFAVGQTLNASSASVNEIALPTTTSDTSGVVTMGGSKFLSGTADSVYLGNSAGGATSVNSGTNNTAVGSAALASNTNGGGNTAIGRTALNSNTTGGGNTAVGDVAMLANLTGGANTAVGSSALQSLTSGSNNTAVGAAANNVARSGNYTTFLGNGAKAGADGLLDATAIGAFAVVSENDALVLGENGVSVGIGTSAPAYELHVVEPNGFTIGKALIGAETSTPSRQVIYGADYATTGTGAGGYFASDSGSGYGVVGANEQVGGHAGYFIGNVAITGTLTKGGGSFKIDDPIDPAGKYLSHSFVESPDMMNLYNGIVTLDGHGAAVVTMPEWFSALNKDFRYTLTAIGTAAPKLHIAEEIHGNEFRIAGGKKGMRVSWMVTGVRQDAWANAHRIPTEQEKTGDEQGKYLHPELFGAGPEKAIGPVVKPGVVAKASNASAPEVPGRE